MTPLHFCRDGVLRRGFSIHDPKTRTFVSKKIPMRAYIAAGDSDAFLKCLSDVIVFEPGLTVAELMENLAPWSDIMTGLACMDFPAFVEEVRRESEAPLKEIDRIRLDYHATLSPTPKFERSGKKKGFLNIGEPVASMELKIDSGWQMNAYLKPEYHEEYDSTAISVGFSPMSDWKHVPIEICSSAVLTDRSAFDYNHAFMGTDVPVSHADHPLCCVSINANDKVLAHEFPLTVPYPTFYEALIIGFFWEVGFHYSPITRDAVAEEVTLSLSELEKSLETDTDIVEDFEKCLEHHEGRRDTEYWFRMSLLQKMQDMSDEMGLAILD